MHVQSWLLGRVVWPAQQGEVFDPLREKRYLFRDVNGKILGPCSHSCLLFYSNQALIQSVEMFQFDWGMSLRTPNRCNTYTPDKQMIQIDSGLQGSVVPCFWATGKLDVSTCFDQLQVPEAEIVGCRVVHWQAIPNQSRIGQVSHDRPHQRSAFLLISIFGLMDLRQPVPHMRWFKAVILFSDICSLICIISRLKARSRHVSARTHVFGHITCTGFARIRADA